MKKIKAFTFFLFLLSYSTQAQNDWLKNVDIYLHTVERGTLVYNNFGHTAIRVHNKTSGVDLVYNWGIFDFKDPVDFSLKFYRGILVYRLGVYPYQNALAYYEKEQRTVWEDKINFTNEEKLIFLKRLDWNNLPENRDYNYHYFFDNCSTRVRDYFNEALGESLKPEMEVLMTGKDFRDAVREGYNTNPEIYFSLDTIMNKNIDIEMNYWQEMFLPAKLRSHLQNYNKTKPFFLESKILMEYPAPIKSTLNGFHIISLLFIFTLSGIFISSLKKKQKAEKFFWSLSALLIFILGIFGLTMALNWIFSGHIDLHENFNLLLLWPTDLLLLWPILTIILKGDRIEVLGKKKYIWDLYIHCHLFFNAMFILDWISGIFQQNTSNLAIFIAPFSSILLYMIKKSYIKKESAMAYGIN